MELTKVLPITHKSGLHARASTKLVELAQRFSSEVYISRVGEDQESDAKSVLAVLMLGVELGMEIQLRIVGPDAEKALEALEDLVRRDFDGV